MGFDFRIRTRIVFERDGLRRLGTLAREAGGERALLVTDPGIAAAGHVDRAMDTLRSSGIAVSVYDRVRENPTTRDVDRCIEAARDSRTDLLIGLGGGSSLDTAKGCGLILANGGTMPDYEGMGRAAHPLAPIIAVPTTAGTGSECQSYALIADETTHRKMACGDPKAAPVIALLDPTLTLSQPRTVTAVTGIDAIAHALESAVTRPRNPMSSLYSFEAFRRTMGSLGRVLEDPGDIEARSEMQIGAAMAGIAIESSMLGAAHSAANPLTARYGMVHGQAVGVMLPFVVRFNAADPAVGAIYRDLAAAAGLVVPAAGTEDAVDALVERLRELMRNAGFPPTLSQTGIDARSVPAMAGDAASQWTARFNPRVVTAPDFEEFYHAAL